MNEEVKISELEALDILTGTEQIPASLDTETYRITPSAIKAYSTKEIEEWRATATGDIESVKASVSSMQSTMDSLSTSLVQVREKVGANEAAISAMDGRVMSAEQTIKVLGNSQQKLEQRVSATELDIEEVTGNIAVLQNADKKLSARIDTQDAKIEEMGSTISGVVESRLQELSGKIDVNSQAISENKGKIATNTTDIAKLQTDVAEVGETAEQAKTASEAAKENAAEAREAASDAKQSAESVVGDVSSLRSSLTALQALVEENKEAIEELDEDKQDNLSAGKGIAIRNNIVSCTYQGDTMLTGSFSEVSGTTTQELTPDSDDSIVEALGKIYSAIRRNEETIAAALVDMDHRLCRLENEIF